VSKDAAFSFQARFFFSRRSTFFRLLPTRLTAFLTAFLERPVFFA
jgi:hypothetical protein